MIKLVTAQADDDGTLEVPDRGDGLTLAEYLNRWQLLGVVPGTSAKEVRFVLRQPQNGPIGEGIVDAEDFINDPPD